VAEGARLESVYTRNRIEGSNPSLTAKLKKKGPDENQDPFSFGATHPDKGNELRLRCH